MDWTTGKLDKDLNQNKEQEQQENQNNQDEKDTNGKEEDKKDKKDKEKTEDKDKANKNQDSEKVIWGVDSASVTTEEVYVCVNQHFGKPEIWGRYLGTIEDVSQGITKEESQYLHEQEIKVLAIYNHFDGAKGYDHGVELAQHAVSLAEEAGLPEGKAIFADIEPEYPVNAAFIQGWFDGIKDASYHPGIYGVFAEEQPLFKEYEQAVKDRKEIEKQLIIWSAHPQIEITSKEKAPEYEPFAPEGSFLLGWQYGLDAEKCNIDTNLFKAEINEYLW